MQLFNGRDLNDWTIKFAHHDLGENFNNTFRVEDGLLKVRYDKWTTLRPASSGTSSTRSRSRTTCSPPSIASSASRSPARAGLAWAMRNNGLMLHSPDPKTMLKDQDFPISIEVQLLGGLSDGKPRIDGERVHAGHELVMNGKLHTRALHQLHIEDLRRRSVGARRGARARRRARSGT